jgi:hypothetical protein
MTLIPQSPNPPIPQSPNPQILQSPHFLLLSFNPCKSHLHLTNFLIYLRPKITALK